MAEAVRAERTGGGAPGDEPCTERLEEIIAQHACPTNLPPYDAPLTERRTAPYYHDISASVAE